MTALPSGKADLGRLLFRLDIDHRKGGVSVLVQSQTEPDWSMLNRAGDFLLEEPSSKLFDPPVSAGTVLYFRLRANPSVKSAGKRQGIIDESSQTSWLERKAKEGGFEVLSLTVIPEGMVKDRLTDKVGSPHHLSLLSVRFEGVLRITDAAIFRQTLEQGIGSGKGLGFGLVSVAPVRN